MNKENFVETFGKSKIPSLLLISMLYGAGIYLIKGETETSYSVIAGAVILIIAVTLTVFSFADYRRREETNSIIKGYDTALKNISKTHSSFENFQQDTLASQKIGGQYTLEDQEKTLDN
ncbi:hypothetical protein ACFL21_03105 [Patescibacteria group bacterium]